MGDVEVEEEEPQWDKKEMVKRQKKTTKMNDLEFLRICFITTPSIKPI
jgi:hypothetical protein